MGNAVRTEGTAEVMRGMAERMRETATKLDRLAEELEKRGNWDTASEAVSIVTNLMPSLRLDLLAARPIREHQYRITALESLVVAVPTDSN